MCWSLVHILKQKRTVMTLGSDALVSFELGGKF